MRTIVTAWVEKCSGPGWANQPCWVLFRNDMTGEHTVECIQPLDQSAGMHTLADVSATVHSAMRFEAALWADGIREMIGDEP